MYFSTKTIFKSNYNIRTTFSIMPLKLDQNPELNKSQINLPINHVFNMYDF